MFFPPPEAARRRRTIFPLFLPFSGCPERCVFCAQDIQTGQVQRSVSAILAEARFALRAKAEREPRGHGDKDSSRPMDLAFYGGTFTALARRDFLACLRFASGWKERGLVAGLRCSTRPDALTPAILEELKAAGFTCIELGVQSFADAALCASQRGYSGVAARKGCALVRDAGLDLGIQLLPGMPGHSFAAACADVEISKGFAPACVRLYPCLVIEGTALAALWREGKYHPWSLEDTAEFLARACLSFQQAGIAVIRIGLAEDAEFVGHVLAGPRHPSLGSMVRARALYRYVREQLKKTGFSPENAWEPEEGACVRLFAPRRFQGEFWGQEKELAPLYAALGLTPQSVAWWEDERFAWAGLRL